MDFTIERDKISNAAMQNIAILGKRYKNTGQLSPSIVRSLKSYHENEKTRPQLKQALFDSGLDFDPFTSSNPMEDPEQEIPYGDFEHPLVEETLDSMERSFKRTGEFKKDDIRRVEKFYLSFSTADKMIRELKKRFDHNPFTGEPF